jgi:hypothetical protein
MKIERKCAGWWNNSKREFRANRKLDVFRRELQGERREIDKMQICEM